MQTGYRACPGICFSLVHGPIQERGAPALYGLVGPGAAPIQTGYGIGPRISQTTTGDPHFEHGASGLYGRAGSRV